MLKARFWYIFILVLSGVVGHITAQTRYRTAQIGQQKPGDVDFVQRYIDSLSVYKQRSDTSNVDTLSLENTPNTDDINTIKESPLFLPVMFSHAPAKQMLQYSDENNSKDYATILVNRALMNVYLTRPDLVVGSEKRMYSGTSLADKATSKQSNVSDIVDGILPQPSEPDVAPVRIAVKKPNFWWFHGDYFLQFLQNYVSHNWYNGGESNYSMLGSVTLQANYNNKQKIKLENKLELRLGLVTSSADTLHNIKSSDNLIRYTGKFGLQATKKWYYTLQLIANTQFVDGVKDNDPHVYSAFLAPFNANISLGMDYTAEWFNKKLTGTAHIAPLALNFTYVDISDLATANGLKAGTHTLINYGSVVTVDLAWKFSDMIKWNTRLYGYTTYKRSQLEWENTIVFQFNKYISTNFYLYPRFDDGVHRLPHDGYWQFKEYFSVGFSYSL